jgi:transposase
MWLRRYRAGGEDGLLDGSSRPHRSPRSLSAEQVELIVRTRVRRRDLLRSLQITSP